MMEARTTKHSVVNSITKELDTKGGTLVMKASITTNLVTEDEDISIGLPHFKRRRRKGGFTPEEMKLTDVLRKSVIEWTIANRKLGSPQTEK